MTNIYVRDFIPLNSHQVGIKIKNLIIDLIKDNEDQIILDFTDVEICTDSFSQQLTTILAHEISFAVLKEKVKFKNLNSFLQEIIKGNLYKALKEHDKRNIIK